MSISRSTTIALAAVATLTLGACSPANENDSTQTEETTAASEIATSSAATESAAAGSSDATDAEGELLGDGDLKLENGTVRAKAAADAEDGTEMTAIFGTIHNTSDNEITVTGFTTSLGEASYEIHETVDGVMQEKEGGITIPAGGTFELAPGGDHLMIMGYAPEIPAGDTVDVTLETAHGEDIAIDGVAVRSMLPGGEDYGEDGQLAGHSAMNHDEMDHGDMDHGEMDHSAH